MRFIRYYCLLSKPSNIFKIINKYTDCIRWVACTVYKSQSKVANNSLIRSLIILFGCVRLFIMVGGSRKIQIRFYSTVVRSGDIVLSGVYLCWSDHHFYENSTSGVFSFLKCWSHRQHIDKRLAWRQTIKSRQATLASGFFSYKVTLLVYGSGPAQIVFLLIITLLY